MKNKVLVTGGAGAIGSNLIKSLIALDYSVIVIDDLSSGCRSNVDEESVRFFQGSILDDELLDFVFKDNDINYVFHLAALFANQNSVEHPEKDLSVNGLGTLKILQKSRLSNVKKVIYTSSSCVYGNAQSMVEDSALTGSLDTPYAITKLLGEQYCKFMSTFYGLDTVILRLFNSYGPGEKAGLYRNVIPNFLKKSLNGESLTITGTGKETRDFTYVDDVVDGIMKSCLANTTPSDIFNIGRGEPVEILELVESINRLTNNKAPITFLPRRSWDHVTHRVSTIDKAKNFLGFRPKCSIKYGLEKTYNWFLLND